jgi:NADH-quinone oxidoreductase subunit C
MIRMDNATIVNALKETFGEAIGNIVEFRNQLIIWVEPSRLVEVCRFLRDDARFQYTFLSDVSGLDRLTMQQESIPSGQGEASLANALRFVVNYQLLSLKHKHRVWLKVGLPADNPTVPSVTSVWTTANFHEREVYDLMGITFTGHPDLRRILLPDNWQGHPLRKDYPFEPEEVQFSHNFERIEKRKKYAVR